jgi:ABC-type Zn2+ transport system substrate-binding protein/surface adhesin
LVYFDDDDDEDDDEEEEDDDDDEDDDDEDDDDDEEEDDEEDVDDSPAFNVIVPSTWSVSSRGVSSIETVAALASSKPADFSAAMKWSARSASASPARSSTHWPLAT